ncbi:7TM diverse intracellular signaling domain-containing protein [Acetivibrio cellulolyticus]|uniref:7TM diverse intracellular signaling domain-containing protein n=1 Tax=Acetivibrio cellulolyticus TaxID=35830 RepID=UPI0001E2E2A7|nr:7TM diverse intracellular signaling domain-containing protein [Acetivibrio cellulolyticus]
MKIFSTIPDTEDNHKSADIMYSLEYKEDKSGKLSLTDIETPEISGAFIPHDDTTLYIGQNRSTWWIRMKLEKIPSDANQLYIFINNPTVETAVLYIPVEGDTDGRYEDLHSGWGFHGKKQDISYTYPVFMLPEDILPGKYIYLQLHSPFTQNYNIGIMDEEQFKVNKQKNILFVGTVFGLMLAIALLNFLSFLSLRDSTYIFYVVYLVLMVFYQNALLGISRIYMGGFADALVSNVVTVGLFMLVSELFFAMAFLKTNSNFPVLDRLAKALILFCYLDVILMLLGYRYEASVISMPLSVLTALLILYMAIRATSAGIGQAKYFLAGWSVMCFSLVIFTARVWGIIPNTDWSLSIVMVSSAIESVLLSIALTARISSLRKEKEQTVLLFKSAEEASISSETAFLQAQIKPHFLYNALNVIAAICRIDSIRARDLVLDLSSYLHHSFDFRNIERYITFDEEMDFIQAYVRIEQARFRDKLTVQYELEDTEELMLPPLILEPLVENAIRHGIRKRDGGGTVAIRVKNFLDSFMIEVEDDGVGMSSEQLEKIKTESQNAGSGVGLVNIQRRLWRLYGGQLDIQSHPGEGTKIILELPKGGKSK